MSNVRFVSSKLYILGLLCVYIFAHALFTHAQVPFADTGIKLTSSHTYPAPHASTTISVSDYSINTIGYDFNWVVNGAPVPSEKNKRSITVSTGDIGTKTYVELRAVSRTNVSLPPASITLSPSVTHIIVESDTYVPSFYKGRALPSVQSPLIATALFMDGSQKTPQSFTYRWKLDGDIISGGALTGMYKITIPTRRFQTGNLSVEIFNEKGIPVGGGSVTIKPHAPELYLYESNPLRGIVQKALTGTFFLPNTETDIIAEPYFMNISDVREANFMWSINQKKLEQISSMPNSLKLNAQDGSGTALLQLTALTNEALPQQARAQLNISYE
ncbi:MAG TPA: hypothetical protein VFV22_00220 [Candidatus Paceibacterota bacterium]|nr:hypothetical protein [Candidatus Paceibacterota bacterium]